MTILFGNKPYIYSAMNLNFCKIIAQKVFKWVIIRNPDV
jgi:hypothetical protein